MLLLFFSAAQTNWYVDNSVGTSGDGTSWATAWKQLSDIAWGSVSPGDTIYVSGGSTSKTYNGIWTIGSVDGAAGSPIRVTKGVDAGHNGTVIIDFGTGDEYLYVNASSLITFDNFTIRNGTDGATVYIWNCTGGITFEDCIVEPGVGEPDGNARGFDLRANTGVNGPNVLRNNVVTTHGNTTGQADGIYCQGNGEDAWLIEYNEIYVENIDNTGHSDCFQSFQDGSMVVRFNLFRGPTAGGENHVVWIADIATGAIIEFYENECISRNGSYNVTVWRSEAIAGTGIIDAHDNVVTGGARAFNFERNANVLVNDNIITSDAGGLAYFVSLTAVTPANIQGNEVNTAAVGDTVANTLGVNKTWAQWQADGYDLTGTLVTADVKGHFASKHFASHHFRSATLAGESAETVTPVAVSDTLLPKTTEGTPTILGALDVVDTLDPYIVYQEFPSNWLELVSILSRNDTLLPKTTEAVSNIAVLVAAAESLLAKATEGTPTLLSSSSVTETLLPKTTQGVPTILSALTRIDTLFVHLLDGLYSDALKPRLDDVASILATLSASDSILPKTTETSAVDAEDVVVNVRYMLMLALTSGELVTPITATDTLLPKTTEVVTALAALLSRVETLLPKVTDAIATQAVFLERVEDINVLLTDAVATIQSTLSRTDDLLPKATEAIVLNAYLTITESLLVKATDTVLSISVDLNRTDDLLPKTTESVVSIDSSLNLAESLLVKATDAVSQIQNLASASDTLLPRTSETVTTLLSILERVDTLRVALYEAVLSDVLKVKTTDSAAVLVFITAADQLLTKLTESVQSILVSLDRTDDLLPKTTDVVSGIFGVVTAIETLRPKTTEFSDTGGSMSIRDVTDTLLVKTTDLVSELLVQAQASDTLRPVLLDNILNEKLLLKLTEVAEIIIAHDVSETLGTKLTDLVVDLFSDIARADQITIRLADAVINEWLLVKITDVAESIVALLDVSDSVKLAVNDNLISEKLLVTLTEVADLVVTHAVSDELRPKIVDVFAQLISHLVVADQVKIRLADSVINDQLFVALSDLVQSLVVSLGVSDTALPTTTEGTTALLGAVAANDTVRPKTTEVTTLLGQLAVSDDLRPYLIDAVNLLSSLSVDDSTSFTLTDLVSTQVALARADQLMVELTDAQSILSALVVNETLDPNIIETASILGLLGTTDQVLPRLLEAASVATLITPISVSDLLNPRTLETVITISVVLARAEQLGVRIDDARTILTTLNRTDNLLPYLGDVAGLIGLLVASDALSLNTSEATLAIAVTLSVVDSFPIKLMEAFALVVFVLRTENLNITTSELVSVLGSLNTNDQLRAKITDAVELDNLIAVLDNLAVQLGDAALAEITDYVIRVLKMRRIRISPVLEGAFDVETVLGAGGVDIEPVLEGTIDIGLET